MRQVAGDRFQQALRRIGDLVDRALERLLVPPRRLAKPAYLAHELPRRRSNLIVGRDHVRVPQRLDASTHTVKDRESQRS